MIPKTFREKLGLTAGSELIVRLEDGQVSLRTRAQAIRQAQEMFQALGGRGKSALQQLRELRKQDLKKELGLGRRVRA